MNRRGFLRSAMGAAVAAALPVIPGCAEPAMAAIDLRAAAMEGLREHSEQVWYAIVSPGGQAIIREVQNLPAVPPGAVKGEWVRWRG